MNNNMWPRGATHAGRSADGPALERKRCVKTEQPKIKNRDFRGSLGPAKAKLATQRLINAMYRPLGAGGTRTAAYLVGMLTFSCLLITMPLHCFAH